MNSLHLIGSADMGGAERWFVRFLHAMQAHGETVHAGVRNGSALAQQHLDGIRHSTLPFATVWDPWSRWQLKRLIHRLDMPIVQTYMGRATRLTRLPPGGGHVHVARLGGYYKLDPFRHAHAFVGNTRGLCDWMVAGGLDAKRVHYVTNFAEPAKTADEVQLGAIRRDSALEDDDFLIVTAGRLIEVKGHTTLLAAFAALPDSLNGRRLRLAILGDGPLAASLQQQASVAGIANRLIWPGWVADPAPWFHLADLVAFPSRDRETLGNVILEAWAYRRPLVCTAFRGARELTRHGEDAWVVPCDDARALAGGLGTVISDLPLMAAMVEAGAARIADEFSEARVISQYRELYRHLIDHG